ncbi:hypothetical protein HDU67_007183 [Dinochytrium kinnereticum]|nr:hypothetical protein HDU67_007183 [Dinochytrium kinnereticum]
MPLMSLPIRGFSDGEASPRGSNDGGPASTTLRQQRTPKKTKMVKIISKDDSSATLNGGDVVTAKSVLRFDRKAAEPHPSVLAVKPCFSVHNDHAVGTTQIKKLASCSAAKSGLNVHAAKFIPTALATPAADAQQSSGPVYVCHPPIPLHSVVEEIDGEVWPVGYPRYLCHYGPWEVIMPLWSVAHNFALVYVPTVYHDILYQAGCIEALKRIKNHGGQSAPGQGLGQSLTLELVLVCSLGVFVLVEDFLF